MANDNPNLLLATKTIAGCNDKEIDLMARRIKALSHPLRLGIIRLLSEGELSVTEIFEMAGTSQPNISHHLLILHNLSLLKSRKVYNRVFYSIADPRLTELFSFI
jgi:DNA-binding transcriptional ArsR family regulator